MKRAVQKDAMNANIMSITSVAKIGIYVLGCLELGSPRNKRKGKDECKS